METRVIVALVCAAAAGAWRVPEGRSRDVWGSQGRARGYYDPDPPHYAYLGLPYAAVRTRFKVHLSIVSSLPGSRIAALYYLRRNLGTIRNHT